MSNDIRAIFTFRRNLKAVHELLRFDDLLLGIILVPLKRTAERQAEHKLAPRLRNDAVISLLENVRQNESLRAHYEAMYNQSLVLLVSYFASAVKELFIDGVASAIESASVPAVLDAQLKISPRDLRERMGNTAQILAEAISDTKDLSFQDMQSISRAFERYFGAAPVHDQRVNDIIAGQACRHAIVHSGAISDRKLVSQLRSAAPRTILPTPIEGAPIRCSRDEVQAVAKEMLRYLRELSAIVESTGTRLMRQPAN